MGLTDAIRRRLGGGADTDAATEAPQAAVTPGETPALDVAADIAANPQTVTLPDGRDLGYAEVGDPDGDPLVFFHGFPNSRVLGALFDDVGAEKGVRVVAPDRPGFGASDPDPDRRLTDWATDLAGLMDALDIDTAPVLGVSAGGPYAVVSAARLPERVDRAGVVAGLAPMDSVGFSDRLWYYSARFLPPLNKLGLYLIVRQALDDREAFLDGIADDAPAADAELWTGETGKLVHASMVESRRRHGLAPLVHETSLFGSPWGVDLGAIDVPVHLWYGEEDSLTPPAMGHYLADRIPDAEAQFDANAGHLSTIVENEAAIVEALVG